MTQHNYEILFREKDIDSENNTKQILSAKEQEVFIGDLPLMTPSATFITNDTITWATNHGIAQAAAFNIAAA